MTDINSDAWPSAETLGLSDDHCTHRQHGGRDHGLKLLHTFLFERGEHYTKAMSSPLDGWDACSRLSPHIALAPYPSGKYFSKPINVLGH